MAYDNIKLEKGLYTTGKSFTQALEEIDPSENYKGTSLEGLDAFQRQLKRFDIKVSGKGSDPVAKFFSTNDSAALFPEYISRAVRQGIQENDKVERLVATTTIIDSMDYRSIESAMTDGDLNLTETNEGEPLREINIRVKDKLTPLFKHGKMLVASYEAIKFQKIDLFTVTLKQIGARISNSEFYQALKTIEDGVEIVSAAGTNFTYSDIVKLWSELDPYNMTTLVANSTEVANLLNMDEFKDAAAGLDFHGTGNLITPLGAEVIKHKLCPTGNIYGIDKSCAVEKVQAGNVITDFDKVIDRQLERATISTITGFSKIFADASKLLKVAG